MAYVAMNEAIWQAHNDRMAMIDADYHSKSLDLSVSYGADILGSMSSIAKNVAGENSSLYKAMFAMEKGMAVARSVMAIQAALAQASANPFPMNLAAMATVAAQTANIVATIQGVQMPQGMAHDGIDKVPADGTWLLKKNERVTTERTSAKLDKTLDEVRSGYATPGLVMNIEVLNQAKGATVETQQIDENRVRIIVRDEVNRFVPNQIADSNSKISKSMQRHTTAKRERA